MSASHSSQPRVRLTIFLAFVFFFLFSLRYWLNATGKPMWMDETDGLFDAVSFAWSYFFQTGSPPGQANRSPFSYILDKSWLALWDYQPQLLWNLRVFFRVVPAALWGLTCAALFVFMEFWLKRRFPSARYRQTTIVAAGVAFFYYSNSFLHTYALEARSYSLWLALSTMHFLLLWRRMEAEFSRRMAMAFYVVCFFLAFTTYASLVQIYAGLACVLLRDLLTKRKLNNIRAYRHDILGLAIATFVGFWYFASVSKMSFPKPPVSLYIESVLEVMLKAFHHHGAQPALVTFPLAFLVAPYFLRKRPEYLALYAFTLCNIALTAVMFVGSYWKGGLYHSRYAIFLLPTLTWAYLAMIACFLDEGLKFARARFSAGTRLPSLLTLFVILSVIQIAGTVKILARDIHSNLTRIAQNPVSLYGPTPNPEACVTKIPHDPEDVEALNDYCRGFKP